MEIVQKYIEDKKLFGGKDPVRFGVWSILIVAIIISGFSYIKNNYRFGLPLQAAACIPGNFFMTDLNDKQLIRDQIYRFTAKDLHKLIPIEELKPIFADGTPVVKFLRGIPGDKVDINADGVFVAGKRVAEGLALYKTLGKESESEFYRTYTLGEGEYFFAGTSEDSFDSRYWGFEFPVKEDQIVGRTYVLL